MEKMPLLFIGHGSPMNAIEDNIYTDTWKKIGASLPRPRAILILSAHWITESETRISTALQPEMIYDMYGFPPELYRVRYDAPGSLEITQEIYSVIASSRHIDRDILLEKSGQDFSHSSKGQEQSKIILDPTRGYDHGVWSTLIHLFPTADIPVIPVSLDYGATPRELVRLGESLSILRERGVLIIGSGNIVHNLGAIDWSNSQKYPWAVEFDRGFADGLTAGKNSPLWESLLDYRSWGEISRLAHPSYDHLLPIFPLMGASSPDDRVEFSTPDIDMGSLSMRSVVWI